MFKYEDFTVKNFFSFIRDFTLIFYPLSVLITYMRFFFYNFDIFLFLGISDFLKLAFPVYIHLMILIFIFSLFYVSIVSIIQSIKNFKQLRIINRIFNILSYIFFIPATPLSKPVATTFHYTLDFPLYFAPNHHKTPLSPPTWLQFALAREVVEVDI